MKKTAKQPKAAKPVPAPKRPAKTVNPRPAKKGVTVDVRMEKLVIHPLLEKLPVANDVVKRLAEDAKKAKGGQYAEKQELHAENAESWAAFVADIKARGIKEDLRIVPMTAKEREAHPGKTHWIIDGRHRFNGGKEADLKEAPCKITNDDPATYILGSVCHRYHWSKQLRAYFALHLHPELVDGNSGARTDLAPTSPQDSGRFATREALAESIGVSDDTMLFAAKVHKLFAKDPAARRKYEPLIFGGISLQGVLKGDGATKSTHGGGDQRNAPWERLKIGWAREAKTLTKDWLAIETAGPEAVAEAKAAFAAYLAALPDALKEHAAHTLAA